MVNFAMGWFGFAYSLVCLLTYRTVPVGCRMMVLYFVRPVQVSTVDCNNSSVIV